MASSHDGTCAHDLLQGLVAGTGPLVCATFYSCCNTKEPARCFFVHCPPTSYWDENLFSFVLSQGFDDSYRYGVEHARSGRAQCRTCYNLIPFG